MTVFSSSRIVVGVVILQLLVVTEAFCIHRATVTPGKYSTHTHLQATNSHKDNDEDDNATNPKKTSPSTDDMITETEQGIPCLPPIGSSSYGNDISSSNPDNVIKLNGESKPVGFLSGKFELQYTCKVCETRNSHKVSRLGTM